MREYLIKGQNGKKTWGTLYYSDKKNSFRIVFRPDITPSEKPPAYVHRFMTNGRNELTGELAWLWVTDRIIPADRQNIDEILRVNGLKYYREIDMLELSMGRATYDDLYLERVC